MATEYVDAGQAVDNSTLSGIIGSAPPVATGVTYDRILNARSEPHNWLTYYGAYDGQRYSPLDQINQETVKRLTPAWVFQCGSVGLHSGKSTYSFEASPIVVDGIMFVSGWDGWVWALDARTGSLLWQYRHAIPYDVSLCCGDINRGVAVAEGKVFVATLNAHIIALDAEMGKKVGKAPPPALSSVRLARRPVRLARAPGPVGRRVDLRVADRHQVLEIAPRRDPRDARDAGDGACGEWPAGVIEHLPDAPQPLGREIARVPSIRVRPVRADHVDLVLAEERALQHRHATYEQAERLVQPVLV